MGLNATSQGYVKPIYPGGSLGCYVKLKMIFAISSKNELATLTSLNKFKKTLRYPTHGECAFHLHHQGHFIDSYHRMSTYHTLMCLVFCVIIASLLL